MSTLIQPIGQTIREWLFHRHHPEEYRQCHISKGKTNLYTFQPPEEARAFDRFIDVFNERVFLRLGTSIPGPAKDENSSFRCRLPARQNEMRSPTRRYLPDENNRNSSFLALDWQLLVSDV